MTEDSVLTTASFGKVAFAYMVMQLVREGILYLDKPAYQYLPKRLPEYPACKDLADDQRYKRITAKMLLGHTSGFPNWRWSSDDQKPYINFESGSGFEFYPGAYRGVFGWMTNNGLALIGVAFAAQDHAAVRTDIEGYYLRTIAEDAPDLAVRMQSVIMKNGLSAASFPTTFAGRLDPAGHLWVMRVI